MYSERIRARLEDIVENAERVAGYLDGFDLERFRDDLKTVDAVERCISRITEAVIQLGEEETLRTGLDVAWHEVRSLGNMLRHEYHRIDRKRIYETACDDLPALSAAANRALES